MAMYRIKKVPTDAPIALEQLGTKPKFWYYDDEFGECLFKECRSRTGDDWAEKIADFRAWKDHDPYQKAFERLLRDLKAAS